MKNIKQLKSNFTGFMLIEALIVLFICCTFFIISIVGFQKWQARLEVENFLMNFEKKLLLTQQLAIVESKNTKILFSSQQNKVEFIFSDKHQKIVIPLSLSATGPETIIFNRSSGNNSNLAKFTFMWYENKEKIEFQFQMGSGRYAKKISAL